MRCVFSAILLTCSLGAVFGGYAQCEQKYKDADVRTFGIDLFALFDSQDSKVAAGFPCIAQKIIVDAVPSYNLQNSDTLFNFLTAIEQKYKPAAQVPYHNNLHGLDVIQTAYALTLLPKFNNAFTNAEKLALLLAAVGHDVDHPGVNNDGLKKLHDANRWNQAWGWNFAEPSTLETHHWNVIEATLNQHNVLAGIPNAQDIKTLIQKLVLYTDMAQHKPRGEEPSVEEVELKQFVESRPSLTNQDQDKANREFVLKTIIHLADVSNPTKPQPFSKKMSGRVSAEFFLQGDNEKSIPVPVTFGCDRAGANSIGTSQVGFINKLVKPIWKLFADLVKVSPNDSAPGFITNMEENLVYYGANPNLSLCDLCPTCPKACQ